LGLSARPVHIRDLDTHQDLVWSHFPSRQVKSLGLKMLVYLVAFSEPPSEITWLENACLSGRIFRAAK
jgi:hypothetical protein